MRKFLLVGRTGVGKSSFINATFGNYIAETSEFEACTKTVEYYAQDTPFGNICLIDTPGLAEDDKALDEKYLDLIRTEIDFKQVEAIIYVTRLDETRFRPDEKRTLQLLMNYLGSHLLNHSWLVFTFAASVPNEIRDEVTRQRVNDIETFLRENALKYPFKQFRLKLRVDNIVSGWNKKGVPILSILREQKSV